MVDELEERERAFKKARMDKADDEVKQQQEEERIKEAGRRMMEAKAEEAKKRKYDTEKEAERKEEESLPPALGLSIDLLLLTAKLTVLRRTRRPGHDHTSQVPPS